MHIAVYHAGPGFGRFRSGRVSEAPAGLHGHRPAVRPQALGVDRVLGLDPTRVHVYGWGRDAVGACPAEGAGGHRTSTLLACSRAQFPVDSDEPDPDFDWKWQAALSAHQRAGPDRNHLFSLLPDHAAPMTLAGDDFGFDSHWPLGSVRSVSRNGRAV